MNKLKNSLYIIAVLFVSSAFCIAAAMPDMHYIGKIMFGVFGTAGFALVLTYLGWSYNKNYKNSPAPKVANRGPVKRPMDVYYRKSA